MQISWRMVPWMCGKLIIIWWINWEIEMWKNCKLHWLDCLVKVDYAKTAKVQIGFNLQNDSTITRYTKIINTRLNYQIVIIVIITKNPFLRVVTHECEYPAYTPFSLAHPDYSVYFIQTIQSPNPDHHLISEYYVDSVHIFRLE